MPRVSARIPFRFLAAAVGAAVIIFLISSAHAQVVTIIDEQPITEQDVQQRSRLDGLSERETPGRQKIIDELSAEIEDTAQARRHGVAPSEDEVNKAFDGIAMRMGVDSQKLTDILTNAGASAATLKQRLRGQMARRNLERGGFDLHGGK